MCACACVAYALEFLCIQHVKDRTFEGVVFLFRHDKVTMLFLYNKGIIYTKSPHYQAITRATRKKKKERDFATR